MYRTGQKSEAITSGTNFAAVTQVILEEMDHQDGIPQYECVGDYDRLSSIGSRVNSKLPQKLYSDCAAYEAIENCHN